LITNLKARTNLHFHLAYDELNAVFSPEEEQTIYRISQEALENVIHHANAKNVWYRFEQNQDAYILSIRDDGKGFKPEELSGKRDRLGIKGMRERAEMIHAQLEILSEPAKGTALKLVLRK
jgi:signal transduction histidine kinase